MSKKRLYNQDISSYNEKLKQDKSCMKKILIWSIILTVITGLLFVSYIVLLFLTENKTIIGNIADVLNSSSGIMAGISFGFWVSYIFERANEKQSRVKEEMLIEKIRNQEFSNLKYFLSILVRDFCMREDQLVTKLKNYNLKGSFSKNDIDIENLTLNYFIFYNILQDLSKYVGENDLKFIKTNIDCMFMKDELAYVYINEEAIETSTTFRDFIDFNKECVKLFKRMLQLNLDYKMEVFCEEELKAIGAFSREIGPGYFTNFYPPYEIIQMFEKLKPIEKFLKADFIPYYKKETFLRDMEEENKKQKEYENSIKEWNKKYNEQAISVLNSSNQT